MEELIKIAIIHGNTPVDGINKNGQIDYINFDINDNGHHIDFMLDYLKNNYKDLGLYQKYEKELYISKIVMDLVKLGEVVFVNTTSYAKEFLKNYGVTGEIFLPNDLNDEQKEGLKKLKKNIDEYDEIQIWYNINSGKQASVKYGEVSILDEFIESKLK